MEMNVILLGPPGAGKGTQAVFISKKYHMPHISTGDILRGAVSRGTELGLKAVKYMNAGELVPDDLVMKLVKERFSQKDCETGYLLDGFPRTIEQANGLEQISKIDAVVLIEVDDGVLLKRLTGRRTCSCGAVYHIASNPPKKEGICDSCGGKLFQRNDDTEAVISNRLAQYRKQTSPLIMYYRKKGILKTVDGTGAIDGISKSIVQALGHHAGK